MPQDKEQPPLIRFHNPRTGVTIYPVMVKDSEGNWVPSDPGVVESLMRDDFHQPKPGPGKK
jgi:hypothetical protein